MATKIISKIISILPKTEDKIVIVIQFLLLGILLVIMEINNIPQGWDILGLLLLVATVWHQRGRKFIIAFLPFFLLIYTYVIFFSYNHQLVHERIHIQDLIHWEQKLFFGYLPTNLLQQWLPVDKWYGHLAQAVSNGLYLSHFIIPLFVILYLWNFYRIKYWIFMIGFMIANYISFIGWALFPAAPPWWATYYHYLSGDMAVINLTNMSTDFLLNIPNPIAAMPSLHAVYPIYITLFALNLWGKKALPIVLYPLSIGFAIVYLGHHYVIDFIAGGLVALCAYLFIIILFNYKDKLVFLVTKTTSSMTLKSMK